MTHEITSIDHVPLGDTKHIPFSVTEDGDPLNLSDGDIEWWLELGGETVLSLDDDGVSIEERDDGEGTFEIHLDAGATDGLRRWSYDERLRITDSNGNQTTWYGKIKFR